MFGLGSWTAAVARRLALQQAALREYQSQRSASNPLLRWNLPAGRHSSLAAGNIDSCGHDSEPHVCMSSGKMLPLTDMGGNDYSGTVKSILDGFMHGGSRRSSMQCGQICPEMVSIYGGGAGSAYGNGLLTSSLSLGRLLTTKPSAASVKVSFKWTDSAQSPISCSVKSPLVVGVGTKQEPQKLARLDAVECFLTKVQQGLWYCCAVWTNVLYLHYKSFSVCMEYVWPIRVKVCESLDGKTAFRHHISSQCICPSLAYGFLAKVCWQWLQGYQTWCSDSPLCYRLAFSKLSDITIN